MSIGTVNITFGDDDVEMQIAYEATPYIPAVWNLSNGDPGYPAEGGDFDIYEVLVDGVNIIDSLSVEDFDKITDIASRAVERQHDDY
jgi:hypothetical protein